MRASKSFLAGLVGLALASVLGISSSARADGPVEHTIRPSVTRTRVPEISAMGAGAAFVLVIGGVAVVLGRRKRT